MIVTINWLRDFFWWWHLLSKMNDDNIVLKKEGSGLISRAWVEGRGYFQACWASGLKYNWWIWKSWEIAKGGLLVNPRMSCLQCMCAFGLKNAELSIGWAVVPACHFLIWWAVSRSVLSKETTIGTWKSPSFTVPFYYLPHHCIWWSTCCVSPFSIYLSLYLVY